jgi:hypothetical protein
MGCAYGGGNCRRRASLYRSRRELCRAGCPVLRKLRKYSDNAGPRSDLKRSQVAILDRSDHSRAAHSDGDGNSGNLCRRHGLLESHRNPESRRPCYSPGADALFVMIGADAVTHWLPAQLQRQNGHIRTGREVSDQRGWAADRAPFLLETNLRLLLPRRHLLQLDQARFEQRRRRQHGHCFHTSILSCCSI